MERAWSRSRRLPKARGQAANIDHQIDALLGTIHRMLKSAVALFSPGDPVFDASKRIIEQVFPGGVRPITVLPFEEQLVANGNIIGRFHGDLEDDVVTSGILPYAAALKRLNEAFKDELAKCQKKEIDYAKLDAAKARGNLFVRQIVAVTIGSYYEDNEGAARKRRALLTPLLDQIARVKQARKGRRAPRDIDPVTGDEIADDEAA